MWGGAELILSLRWLFLGRTERFGYRQDDMVILLDQRGGNEAQQPTRDNIVSRRMRKLGGSYSVGTDRPIPCLQLRAMQWLVQGAQPNDALFFHCTLSRRVSAARSQTLPAGKLAHFTLQTQDTDHKSKQTKRMKLMDWPKRSVLSTTNQRDRSPTTRCIGSWSRRYLKAADSRQSSIV